MINRKYSYENFISLFNQGLNDVKIAEILTVSPKTIQTYRVKLQLPVQTFHYELTDFQRSVLIGTMLGDGHLRKNKDSYNVSGSMGHCVEQEQYVKYKYSLLKELSVSEPKIYKNKVKDKRNDNLYEGCYLYFRGNSGLNWYYNNFYIKGVKRITKEILEYFDEVSLAFMYMDDGYKATSGGYYIATNCFNLEDLELFKSKLKEFNITCNIDKLHRVYIPTKNKEIFNKLVKKWMIPSMYYKLHNSAVLNKQDELLENPITVCEGNQQPSLSSNTLEGSTTNSQIQTDNAEDSNGNTSVLPFNIDSNGFSTIIIDDNIVKWKPMKGIDY